MKILALELSSPRGSVALCGTEEIVREFPNDRKHSGVFFEALQESWRPNDLPDVIVVGLGPGSYAGIRIAISAAMGLAAASRAQLAGVPSVCAMDISAREYCVLGDARRESFFFAHVLDGNCVEGPQLFSEPDLRAKLSALRVPVVSSQPLPQFPEVTLAFPSATRLARRSFVPTELPLEPLYLREPHLTQPRA